MMKQIKRSLRALVVVLSISTLFAGAVMPAETTYAACDKRFLTFPAWFNGVTENDCSIKNPGDFKDGIGAFIWRIVFNILEIMLQLVVYISAGFIIWGGYMYLISTGSSDKITTARKMIQNALIGLVISLFAVIAVSFISGQIIK